MRKSFSKQWLYAKAAPARRSAFTLAELVVAIGVLLLMLSLAGQVFNLTIQSTGQATALTHISQQLRALERTLRDDLRDVQPGESLIVIQGNPVNAYWTGQGQEADSDRTVPGAGPANGYPHLRDPEREVTLPGASDPVPQLPRADMLMFFSNRVAGSYVDPTITSNVQQVVYGHAELGEYVPKGGTTTDAPTCDNPTSTTTTGAYEFQSLRSAASSKTVFPTDGAGYPSPTKLCEVPASEWHLARRTVLLVPTQAPGVATGQPAPPSWPNDTLFSDRLLRNESDILWNFNYDGAVLKPRPGPGPPVPPVYPLNGCWQPPAAILDSKSPPMVTIPRSRLDPTPPALCANRLGHYLLPNCASFKVEWSLNPRSDFVAGRLDGGNEILWFDPGYLEDQTKPNKAKDDPLQPLKDAIEALKNRTDPASVARTLALKSLLGDVTAYPGRPSTDPAPHPDGLNYTLAQRFGTDDSGDDCKSTDRLAADGRANLVLFAANRRVLPVGGTPQPPAYVPDDIFPGALRITVDVFDPEHRLERPIRHVMVIPVGRS